jgi:hypothetical protein
MGRISLAWFGVVMAMMMALCLGAPGVAAAKQSQSFEYRFSQVWSGAFRLIRVDLECRVTDRDDEIGFLMFEYSDGERSYPGSAQLVPVKENGKDVIRVEIQIPEQPTYIEIMILDKLRKKLLDEYGEPVVAPAPQPPGNGPNGGKNGDPNAPRRDKGTEPPGNGGGNGGGPGKGQPSAPRQ